MVKKKGGKGGFDPMFDPGFIFKWGLGWKVGPRVLGYFYFGLGGVYLLGFNFWVSNNSRICLVLKLLQGPKM